MKRILLPFFLFSSAAFSHGDQILITHPQANVNYYCQRWQTLDQCIDVACSYATQYDCRVIAQNQNQYFIETYISPSYRPPPVVIVSEPPPMIYFPPIFTIFSHHHDSGCGHRVYHRPRRR